VGTDSTQLAVVFDVDQKFLVDAWDLLLKSIPGSSDGDHVDWKYRAFKVVLPSFKASKS